MIHTVSHGISASGVNGTLVKAISKVGEVRNKIIVYRTVITKTVIFPLPHLLEGKPFHYVL
jgi:hypothetical protein